MTIIKYKEYLISWLKDELQKTGCNGFVVGISGGIDSAVVASLAKAASENNFFVSMPINSIKEEHNDSLKVMRHLGSPDNVIDLSKNYDDLVKTLKIKDKMSLANIKPRLRMTTLYAIAQEKKYLVLGTDNYIEYMIGYFTKHGDGACDLLPLVQLTKGQVKELAHTLDVPEFIINKKPTAGLWSGQTDEEELGISYDVLDQYSESKKVSAKDKKIIENLIKVSQHKRSKVPMPKAYLPKIVDFSK